MLNAVNKHLLVFDLSGSYTFMAERFAQDFGSVKYFSAWQSGFSCSKDFLPGVGLSDVERVQDLFEVIDKIDMCFFCDVGAGDLQEYLRRQGIPVFGCGAAQVLETDRLHLKHELETAGLPTAKYRVVHGIDELRRVLQKEKNLYIKFSYFRGDMETFHHRNWFASETWLDNFALNLGPYGKIATFLIEEPIEGDAVEVGYDGYAVDGVLPENIMWGYEVKDAAFIATTDPLPGRLQNNAAAWSEILQEYKYRGIISTEVRVTKDKDFLIDATCRCPSPPSEIECALIENFSDIIWEGANGKLIEPEYKARYGAEFILSSDWIVDHPLALKIDKPDNVFIHGHFQIKGNDYAVVPEEFPEFGGAVGTGDTLEEAIAEAFEAAESVDGHRVHFDSSAMSEALETIERGEKLGLTWANFPKKKAMGE